MKFILRYKWIILVAAIIIAAIALSVYSALSPGRALGGSGILGSALKPIQTSLNSISERLNTFWSSGRIIEELRAENSRLRRHAATVDEQSRLYHETLKENERLRDILEFKQKRRDFELMPATVIAGDIDNYARTFTISRGDKHGVVPQMLALNEFGQIVGVVSEVGSDQSVLRMLVDSDFACGAYIFRSRDYGVCRGRFELMYDNKLTMIGFGTDTDIKEGDEVLTSDIGEVFPRDLVIGYVSDLEYDRNGMTVTAIITPAAELTHVEQVFLIMSFESED
ncbi:MAG: rod shape-determining protein MreC [Oscillospiraceae bacterium]|nr:rod shape-determining protein MreC [Oscillospiraceae bacterium]